MAEEVAAGSGPSVEQGQIEFRALESGNHHAEMIFQKWISIAECDFTVINGTGETVAKHATCHRVRRR